MTEINLTPSQLRMVNRISEKFHDVKVTNCKYFAAVVFTNGEDHLFNTVRYQVFIGKRGAVRFVSADRVMLEDGHWKTLANLAGHELGINTWEVRAV